MIDQTTAPYAALALRLTTGGLFLAHGLTKLLVFTIPGTVGFFESMGLPAILAYLTIIAEIGGGIALILGVATRLVSLAVLPVLLGAIWAHSGAGWMFSNEGGGWEFPLFWAVAQIALALLGNGAFALKLPIVEKTLGQYA
ncbi:DoxX family protein [Aliiroseovarius sp. S1123]|uniref:DoxX family protein n=1 Tax=unclassified Aliiroseovarius TaxID=2623558 RepID=UPI001FF3AD3C|nr:DoxX family protein [Aliiroseovarius sp. S1123]MCK0171169.1 DoxX family protein [Aliiroseovarius sp. S1123]